MMRITLLILLSLAIASCYRANNTPAPYSLPRFNILAGNGSRNLKNSSLVLDARDSTNLVIDLSFQLISGNPENYPISCYISNLPGGISVVQDSFTFKLNMQISFSLSIKTDTGYYTANINVVTPDSGLKTYPVLIHVSPVEDCSRQFSGVYTGKDPCGHFAIGTYWQNYTAVITAVPSMPHWITIQNYHGLGDSIIVYAFVNCNESIDIPLQTVKGYTVYGRGKGYWGNGNDTQPGKQPIHIYGDTIVHAGDTTTCYTQLYP